LASAAAGRIALMQVYQPKRATVLEKKCAAVVCYDPALLPPNTALWNLLQICRLYVCEAEHESWCFCETCCNFLNVCEAEHKRAGAFVELVAIFWTFVKLNTRELVPLYIVEKV
jgi:hypothetical protein